jgi:hypothetical protein
LLSRLIPDGFLTVSQAADQVTVMLYSGIPDTPAATGYRARGLDVADGSAIDDAISKLWTAVDRGKLQVFAVGPTGRAPLKLSAAMTEEIPLLRSPRGGSLNFLRPSNRNFKQFLEWFGPDLGNVSIVFREDDISRLARILLRARRRKAPSESRKHSGRPSIQSEVKRVIHVAIDQRKWSSTQSLKALATCVNHLGKWMTPVSDDTVQRALDDLHSETGDRRFERPRRQPRKAVA